MTAAVAAPARMPPPAALVELDANLHAVCCSLQGLLGLLGDAPGSRPVPADGLRHLLLPLADQVDQAAQAAQLLLRLPVVCPGATQ